MKRGFAILVSDLVMAGLILSRQSVRLYFKAVDIYIRKEDERFFLIKR